MIEPTATTVPGRHGELAVQTWSGRAPGWIALIAHGHGEHSGRYQWVAEQLVAARAVVCAPDHVGHGHSPGERVLIEDAEDFVADLESVREHITKEYPDLPVVVIGHSLGGMLAVRYAQHYQPYMAALVLSAPVLGTWHVLDLLGCDDIPHTPIDPSSLSRDPRVGHEYAEDPLVWHGPFKRTTLLAVDSCLRAINSGPALRVPTLWLHGEDDELVPEADTRTGINQIRGTEFHEHIYPGARHELFLETNAEGVLNDVVTFVGRELNT
ncbi:alpha-beta hydrolase superfamily lysophospholipase [Saccharopolyspora lacisalsi]|uniref:Alpha-beta hydrolase superfamily lysophospholipase n=1 Tax=Halosaccharopolyspora lacisalsi TaxID=1000566 RepID=A0A839E4W6_9PSEU|nr:alpha/beta hydrolase [Halosaccharopolyspora lacisalsi]MBA8826777.1 alpha-beta hydrolase superfamily lysophospholipase [Halosaccharopolyspora lacisalsi]